MHTSPGLHVNVFRVIIHNLLFIEKKSNCLAHKDVVTAVDSVTENFVTSFIYLISQYITNCLLNCYDTLYINLCYLHCSMITLCM